MSAGQPEANKYNLKWEKQINCKIFVFPASDSLRLTPHNTVPFLLHIRISHNFPNNTKTTNTPF